jgi:hypothetical protein
MFGSHSILMKTKIKDILILATYSPKILFSKDTRLGPNR